MKRLNKYNYYLYIALAFFIGLDILLRSKYSLNSLLLYFGLYLLIVVNDHYRRYSFYRNYEKYFVSILVTMLISFILAINIGGYIDIYFYMILYELILFTEGKISKFIISIDILLMIALFLSRILPVQGVGLINFFNENMLDILMISMGLLFYCLTLFAHKALRREKREVDRLNKELELSYNKLKEQSEKLEELTIAKERNRVAGEIHDNLGHNLVALNMNLDVAEKILESDQDKAKGLISKSRVLTKESMENLRKAVYALKENKPTTLKKSLRRMIDNIHGSGNIKISLKIDEAIEEFTMEYKDVIYSSIKEAITNSIKHGKAREVNISINLDEHGVKTVICDNGSGCNMLVKGNGLLAIEERVNKLGGSVNYDLSKGFKIELLLTGENACAI